MNTSKLKNIGSSIIFGIITTIIWFLISFGYFNNLTNPLTKSKFRIILDRIFSYPAVEIWGRGYGGGMSEMINFTIKIGLIFIIMLSLVYFIIKRVIKQKTKI